MDIVVKTLHGLEEVLAKEIEQLGGQNIRPLKRAVSFEGDLGLLYKANFELRTAMRIITPIRTFTARNENDLYRNIQKIDWSEYMSNSDTLAIDGVASSRIFRHSKYVALKTKDAIVDQFRDRTGKRPNVNVLTPSLRVNIHIHDDFVTVSLDSSGESLHKRGYRTDVMEAPINEVLAAGMIQLAGWHGQSDLTDPMMGSGTIPIEAAMIATNTPAGMYKEWFGFQKWRNFDEALWKDVQQEAMDKIKPFNHKIYGFDKEFKAMRIAQRNVQAARMEDHIEVKRKPFERLERPSDDGILIMNPPYDVRLENTDINEFYEMIGARFKKAWEGCHAWIISSNMEALKHIGLRTSRKIVLFNGALECKFQKYEMYAGSRRKPREVSVSAKLKSNDD